MSSVIVSKIHNIELLNKLNTNKNIKIIIYNKGIKSVNSHSMYNIK